MNQLDYISPNCLFSFNANKVFRHVETLFVQGNQVCTESKQTSFLITKKGGLFWFSTNLITLDEWSFYMSKCIIGGVAFLRIIVATYSYLVELYVLLKINAFFSVLFSVLLQFDVTFDCSCCRKMRLDIICLLTLNKYRVVQKKGFTPIFLIKSKCMLKNKLLMG